MHLEKGQIKLIVQSLSNSVPQDRPRGLNLNSFADAGSRDCSNDFFDLPREVLDLADMIHDLWLSP